MLNEEVKRIMATIHGVIHGKTIELESEHGLPEGQRVAVEVRPLDEPPAWLERLGWTPPYVRGSL